MGYNKIDAQAKLSKQHDIIKTHPYRMNFDPKWRRDYIECLLDLSDIWSEYIWKGNHPTDEERKLMRQFGRWVHNYNQELLFYRGRMDVTFERFYYYEQMLQLTHRFVETGELQEYYAIDYLWDDKHVRYRSIEKYELITTDNCGIDSSMLPCYLPTKYSMCTDYESIREYISSDFHYSRKTIEERETICQNWIENVAPVLEWLNAKHEDVRLKHAVWESAQLAV